jgi:hypothetical protein
MNRARFVFAATFAGASLAAGTTIALAQQPKPAPMVSVLAGKKFTPPLKGQAEVQFTKPVTKKEKDIVVTTFLVKNMSKAPIARLTVDETWYDDKGVVVTGGKGTIPLLQPDEVKPMRIESGWNPKMKANNWNFSHPNGTVKPKMVAKLDGADTKEPAAKNASAPKKTKK